MEATQCGLTKRNLWTYTLGSVGRDMAATLYFYFLLTFVLFTKSLTTLQFSVISVVIVLAKLFDAFNDPIMGNILEVTRSKWGKFKPWIAVGMVLSAAVFYISFSNTAQGWSYVILFAALYFAYSIVFTMNDIAYWGMLPSLASGKADRDLLTSRAIFFSGMGGGITQILVPIFTAGKRTIGGNALTAYRVLTLILCAFFIGMQLITLFGVREKPLPPKTAASVNRVSFKTIFRTIRGNDQLSWCIVIFLLNTVGNGLISGGLGVNFIYFSFDYNGLYFTLFSTIGGLAAGAVMFFFASVSRRFTRARLMKISTAAAVCGYAFMLLVGLLVPGSAGIFKFALLLLGNLFAFSGLAICYMIIMICIANTVEYNEWKTGERAEGIIFSVRPFVTKLGWAAIQLMVLVIYLLADVRGVTEEISKIENQASQGLVDAAQKAGAIREIIAGVPPQKGLWLLVCMTVLPALFAVASYVLYSRKITLTEAKYDLILEELARRKEERA